MQVGASFADGHDVAIVEAMKMEIPVASPADGTKVDEVAAIAIVTR